MPRRAQRTIKLVNRTGRNLPDLLHYRQNAAPSAEEQAIADQLRAEGYVILPNFMPSDAVAHLKAVMDREIAAGERVRPVSKLITGYDSTVTETQSYDWNAIDTSLKDPLTVDKGFVDVVLDRRILNIANAYLRTYAAVYAFSAWHNAVSDREALGSFNWHRDPEGPYLVKSFVYLNDIDEESTHFAFVRGSHRGRPQSWKTRHGMPDEEMARYIPEERWVHMTGPAGTVVLADTNGFHKGNKGRKERYMLTTIYQVARTTGPLIDRTFLDDPDDVQRRALRFCRLV